MAERWYLVVQHTGAMSVMLTEHISRYVKQRDLGAIVPRLCYEKIEGRRQREYYLFLAVVSETKGLIPPEVNELIHDINLGHPLEGSLSYDEVANSGFVSGEIETANFSRQIKTQKLVKRPLDNPLDFSEHEESSGQAENYNKLLYWLSATGTGTWQTFQNACKVLGLAADNATARHLFRRLRSLGHTEYLENGREWVVCPTCLVQKAGASSTYFVVGQTTPGLLDVFQRHVLLRSSSQADHGAPDVLQLTFPTPNDVGRVLDLVTEQSNGRQIYNVGEAGPRLAHILPDVKQWKTILQPFSIDASVYQVYRWDGNNFSEWIAAPTEAGMYRFCRTSDEGELNYFVFYDPERDAYLQGDWYGLRYLANYYLEIKPCVYYYESAQQLLLPYESRLPDLYERALVLASGQLPNKGSSGIVFDNIPLGMLDALARKLHFEIKDWTIDE